METSRTIDHVEKRQRDVDAKMTHSGKEKEDKIVYVIGVFDLFHRGHLELLKRAKELGSKLIVAVNSDSMVASYKRKPFFSEEDRLELVKALKYVDEAFVIDQYDNRDYIKNYGIDLIVHGDDWEEQSYMEQIRVDKEFLAAHKAQLVLLPYTKGISTSELIGNIRNT
ncbi:adenylyltransferase/cytidyltransferase family protein [Salinimicrobium sp. TH3]|uniref:adenylyltransferase/cytidyltransferase family protein n=1 Tax=Salinimicrobium sp. TH3 TaxID=2997342 RepID=UPI002273E4A8|nr:adenylyltransferase/cytidyltransferase family protein [Salinimicrobium sp. TH3]MCY2687769.1 adenylyltransferase/cytidyltransferase family protein [Salinimicrobium sp. TH3]